MRRTVVALHLMTVVLAIQKDNRPPFAVLEALIDTIGLSFDLALKIGIARNVSA